MRAPKKTGWVLTPSGFHMVRLPRPSMRMPAIFCLSTNPTEVWTFIELLRRRLLSPPVSGTRALARRSVEPGRGRQGAPRWIAPYIDFASIQQITPSAAVVLAAEYDRARRVLKKKPGTREMGPQPLFAVEPEKWRPEVLDALVDIGFLDILGIIDTSFQNPDTDRIVIQKIRSGDENDPKEISGLLDALETLLNALHLDPGDACFELQGALGEAMENVVARAYPPDGKYLHKPIGRWWMTGAVDKQGRRMSVTIFDQGVSIPGSLANWKRFQGFKGMFRKILNGLEFDVNNTKYDGETIRAAIEESATVTEQSHHGKGLAHIQSFVEKCTQGTLRITSRTGYYEYRKGGHKVTKQLDQDIGGTLIEWDIVV